MPLGMAKSSFRFSSLMLFSRDSIFSPFMFASEYQERPRREKFELLLDVAMYLLLDDGVRFCTGEFSSTVQ